MAEWELYTTDTGACPVEKEVKGAGLDKGETARLRVLMDNIAAGTAPPGDRKSISSRPGMYEAKLNGNKRTFRLIFFEFDDRPVLLAVVFTPKKKDSLSPATFDTAEKRQKDWVRRNPLPQEPAQALVEEPIVGLAEEAPLE